MKILCIILNVDKIDALHRCLRVSLTFMHSGMLTSAAWSTLSGVSLSRNFDWLLKSFPMNCLFIFFTRLIRNKSRKNIEKLMRLKPTFTRGPMRGSELTKSNP